MQPLQLLEGTDPLGRENRLGSWRGTAQNTLSEIDAATAAVARGDDPLTVARAFLATRGDDATITLNGRTYTRATAGMLPAVVVPGSQTPFAPTGHPDEMTPDEYANVLLNIEQEAALEAVYLQPGKPNAGATGLYAVVSELREAAQAGAGLNGKFGSWVKRTAGNVVNVVTVAATAVVTAPIRLANAAATVTGKVAGAAANSGIPVIKQVGQVGVAVTGAAQAITQKVLSTVQRAVTLPRRASVTLLLKTFNGPVARGFIYALIPDGAPILAANPAVADKRKMALEVVNIVTSTANFDKAYLQKHLRNAVVKHYRKTPEQVIAEWSGGQGLTGMGQLGDPISLTAIVAAVGALLPAIPLVINVFKKEKLPAPGDFTAPVQPPQVNPNAHQPGGGSQHPPAPGDGSSLKTALMIGGGLAAAGALVLLARKK